MNSDTETSPWEVLVELANYGDRKSVEAFFLSTPSGEVPRIISRLSPEEQALVFSFLSPERAADLLEAIPDSQAVDVIEHLPISEAATIVGEMRSDEQADLLAELDSEEAEAILAELSPEDAADVKLLSHFAPDVAGGLMITEFVSYPASLTVQDVVEDMRLRAEEYANYEVQYVYIVSPEEELLGVLRLRDLVITPRATPLTQIMISAPLSVPLQAPLKELQNFFDRHEFLGVPVVDPYGCLVGVLQRRAVIAAVGEIADSDYLKQQGIVGGDELRTMPLLTRARRRLSWLSVNILLNIAAASIIAMYQDTLTSVIALAVFLPIISDMSGCSGNQAVAVSMRELSLGVVKPLDTLRVWSQELSVGLLNGVALGCLIAFAAWLWAGNVYLGMVVGGALALNTMIAVSVGGVMPLLLKRLNKDPALASGPILTTVTDMCGFLLVLSFATHMLPYLTTP